MERCSTFYRDTDWPIRLVCLGVFASAVNYTLFCLCAWLMQCYKIVIQLGLCFASNNRLFVIYMVILPSIGHSAFYSIDNVGFHNNNTSPQNAVMVVALYKSDSSNRVPARVCIK